VVWIRHARRGLAFPETAIDISLRDHPSTSRRASWYYTVIISGNLENIKWSRRLRTRNAFGIEFASDGAGRLACGEEAAKILWRRGREDTADDGCLGLVDNRAPL
jgi:hypothetical protein